MNCVRSQGAYFEGDWGIIVLCTLFLVSPSINVSFIVHGWILSGQASCICVYPYLQVFLHVTIFVYNKVNTKFFLVSPTLFLTAWFTLALSSCLSENSHFRKWAIWFPPYTYLLVQFQYIYMAVAGLLTWCSLICLSPWGTPLSTRIHYYEQFLLPLVLQTSTRFQIYLGQHPLPHFLWHCFICL